MSESNERTSQEYGFMLVRRGCELTISDAIGGGAVVNVASFDEAHQVMIDYIRAAAQGLAEALVEQVWDDSDDRYDEGEDDNDEGDDDE